MKVKELIEKLQKLDQDLEASIEQYQKEDFVGIKIKIGQIIKEDKWILEMFWSVWSKENKAK